MMIGKWHLQQDSLNKNLLFNDEIMGTKLTGTVHK